MIRKYMKTVLLIFPLLLLVCCGKENAETIPGLAIHLDYDGRCADKMFLSIIDALENQDAAAIKELFSANASEEIEHIDAKADELLAFYQGKITGCTKAITSSSKNICDGKTVYEITGDYEFHTTEEAYRITFSFVTQNDNNPAAAGLYEINILTQELAAVYNGWGGSGSDIRVYKETPDSN